MIVATESQMTEISQIAAACYPYECCGLLAGADLAAADIRITRVVPSNNVSQRDTRDSFEVDPKVRYDLMCALEGTPERIVGHYHSHPDHPAEPSATDLSMVYEPDLFWLIASVSRNDKPVIRAFQAAPDATAFTPIPIQIIKE